MSQTKKIIIAVVAIGIVFTLINISIISSNQNKNANQQQTLNSTQQVSLNDLTKKYNCQCGDCDLKLNNCDCEGAQEMKKLIEHNLNQGKSKDEIMNIINRRYEV